MTFYPQNRKGAASYGPNFVGPWLRPDEAEAAKPFVPFGLLYVGMTRAKDELDLIVPHRFFTYNQAKWGDRHVYASVSRFIPKSIQDEFERRHWNEPQSGPDTKKPKLHSKIDIAANVGRMWR